MTLENIYPPESDFQNFLVISEADNENAEEEHESINHAEFTQLIDSFDLPPLFDFTTTEEALPLPTPYDFEDYASIFTDNQSIYQFYENNDDCDSLHSHSSVSNIIYTNKIKEKLRNQNSKKSSTPCSSTSSTRNSSCDLSSAVNVKVTAPLTCSSKITKTDASSQNSPKFYNLPSSTSNSSLSVNLKRNHHYHQNSRSRSTSLGAVSVNKLLSITPTNSSFSLNNTLSNINDSPSSAIPSATPSPTSKATNPFYRPPAILKRLSNSE